MQNTVDRSNTLQHERLDAFAVAVELDGAVVAIAHRAGRGHAWIADQVMRASASVVLNLAEALGREGADRAQALRIARGSALELDAALTLMHTEWPVGKAGGKRESAHSAGGGAADGAGEPGGRREGGLLGGHKVSSQAWTGSETKMGALKFPSSDCQSHKPWDTLIAMSQFPFSDWQAEQLRLSAFPMPEGRDRKESWWEEVAGTPPEEVTSNPKKGGTVVSGPVDGQTLILSYDPLRIDWLLSAFNPEFQISVQVPDFRTMGSCPEALPKFQGLMEKWLMLKSLPPIGRLAFGSVFLHPEPDKDAAYNRIHEYLPISVDSTSSSDFLFQVNHATPFGPEIPNLSVNRLSKWSISGLKSTLITPASPTPLWVSRFAFRLELDINTNPEFGSALPPEFLIKIFQQMITHGSRLATSGTLGL